MDAAVNTRIQELKHRIRLLQDELVRLKKRGFLPGVIIDRRSRGLSQKVGKNPGNW